MSSWVQFMVATYLKINFLQVTLRPKCCRVWRVFYEISRDACELAWTLTDIKKRKVVVFFCFVLLIIGLRILRLGTCIFVVILMIWRQLNGLLCLNFCSFSAFIFLLIHGYELSNFLYHFWLSLLWIIWWVRWTSCERFILCHLDGWFT